MSIKDKLTTSYGFKAEPGMIINEQYKLIEPIGSGASCDVWSAQHLFGDFICALKFLNPTSIALKLGRDEFKLLAQIYHPNIIRTFDMGYANGSKQPFMSMEFMNGKSFLQIIEEDITVEADTVLKWMNQLISALTYLRRMNIIHKDIKPANLMFAGDKAVLIDFNISLKNSSLVGTPAYKCPTVNQLGTWTFYADLWALALSFYEILTKKEVFESITDFNIELNEVCPFGFSQKTFYALKNIIKGAGQTVEINQIKELFRLDNPELKWKEIPKSICDKFSISSRNQKFIVFYLMNQYDYKTPRSKNVILSAALKQAGLPAGADAIRKLRPVLSQLKNKTIVEYAGQGNSKIVLTQEFIEELEKQEC